MVIFGPVVACAPQRTWHVHIKPMRYGRLLWRLRTNFGRSGRASKKVEKIYCTSFDDLILILNRSTFARRFTPSPRTICLAHTWISVFPCILNHIAVGTDLCAKWTIAHCLLVALRGTILPKWELGQRRTGTHWKKNNRGGEGPLIIIKYKVLSLELVEELTTDMCDRALYIVWSGLVSVEPAGFLEKLRSSTHWYMASGKIKVLRYSTPPNPRIWAVCLDNLTEKKKPVKKRNLQV